MTRCPQRFVLVSAQTVMAAVARLLSMNTARSQRMYSSANRWAPHCPACGQDIERIARRWPDRLMSLFRPVYRYRCTSDRCGWHGNVRSS